MKVVCATSRVEEVSFPMFCHSHDRGVGDKTEDKSSRGP